MSESALRTALCAARHAPHISRQRQARFSTAIGSRKILRPTAACLAVLCASHTSHSHHTSYVPGYGLPGYGLLACCVSSGCKQYGQALASVTWPHKGPTKDKALDWPARAASLRAASSVTHGCSRGAMRLGTTKLKAASGQCGIGAGYGCKTSIAPLRAASPLSSLRGHRGALA